MSPEDKYRADILDPIAWLDGTNEPMRWVDDGTTNMAATPKTVTVHVKVDAPQWDAALDKLRATLTECGVTDTDAGIETVTKMLKDAVTISKDADA